MFRFGEGAGRARRRAASLTSPPHLGGDGGITLVEVMVSMSLMAVITSLFAGGIVQAYRLGTKNESMAAVQADLHNAFSRMDAQVRYASSISEPGGSGTHQYVELANSSTGTVLCTQYRVSTATGRLQSRTWAPGGPASGWSTLASNLTAPAGFVRTVAVPNGPERQRLTVTLSVTAGKAPTATSERSSVTFTALNTSLETDSDHDPCQAMGRP